MANTALGLSRLFASALVAGVLVAPMVQAQGISGPYLAAQQAERRGDIAAAARLYSETLARDSANGQIMERAMIHLIAAGQVPDGIALARRYEEIAPGHHLGVLALAADGLKRNTPAEVRALLDTQGTDSGPFVGRIMDAWAAYGLGEIDTAKQLLIDLEQADSNGSAGQIVAAYHLGLVEAASGDDEAAAATLERAATMADGGTLRLARLRAGALARLGRKEDAVAVINDRLSGTYGNLALTRLATEIAAGVLPDVVVDTPAEGAAEVLYGVSGLLARGRNRLIALAYSRLATHLDPELAEAQLLIAQVLDQDLQFDLAIEAYDSIANDAPEKLTAMIGKAEALQALERADDAISVMKATVERFPDALEARTSLGDMLRRESRFEEAGKAYDGAVSMIPDVEPHHWALFYQRGIAHERSKQWTRAEADFKKALDLQPDQPDVLNYLGYSWVEKGLNLDEAEAMIEKAVDQRPDDGYIVDSLGWVLYRLGDFERAVEHLERAVELRPVDPVINDHYGDALWMVGRKIEARFQWKRALSFEPPEEESKRIRRKLAKGLAVVLAAEKAEGIPGIIGRTNDDATDGTDKNGG